MKLSEIVAGFVENIPAGFVLGPEEVTGCVKRAVKVYCGYATITAAPLAADGIHTAVDASDTITGDQDFELNQSEYASILPLFELYIELENAMHLEASRGLGVDVYGRSVSEISQEIQTLEDGFAKLVSSAPCFTV